MYCPVDVCEFFSKLQSCFQNCDVSLKSFFVCCSELEKEFIIREIRKINRRMFFPSSSDDLLKELSFGSLFCDCSLVVILDGSLGEDHIKHCFDVIFFNNYEKLIVVLFCVNVRFKTEIAFDYLMDWSDFSNEAIMNKSLSIASYFGKQLGIEVSNEIAWSIYNEACGNLFSIECELFKFSVLSGKFDNNYKHVVTPNDLSHRLVKEIYAKDWKLAFSTCINQFQDEWQLFGVILSIRKLLWNGIKSKSISNSTTLANAKGSSLDLLDSLFFLESLGRVQQNARMGVISFDSILSEWVLCCWLHTVKKIPNIQ